MAGVIRLQNSLLRRVVPLINKRCISTSQKNTSEAINVSTSTEQCKVTTKKNWVNYGFDTTSEEADRNAVHSILFASITLCIVFGGFILLYIPDYNLRDWAQREAFLELRRREHAGLPLIDPNLIDPAKISLPSDEDLGNTEIII